MTTIRDNQIFGENYFTSGRYDYTAIDRTYANGTGTQDCISGIKPKKFAGQICRELQTCQQTSMESLLAAIGFGESGNSEAIYLYATNTGEIYAEHLRNCIVDFKEILDTPEDDRKVSDILSLVRKLRCAFYEAVERYKKEFADTEECRFQVYTALDVYMCVQKWLDHYQAEYMANHLAGYEVQP